MPQPEKIFIVIEAIENAPDHLSVKARTGCESVRLICRKSVFDDFFEKLSADCSGELA